MDQTSLYNPYCRKEERDNNMEKDKTSLYLLSIVGVVAIVGIVVLILNSGNLVIFSRSTEASPLDNVGEAISIVKTSVAATITCIDTDNGKDYEKKGKTYTNIASFSTDDCDDSKTVREYYCQDTKTISSTTEDCSDKATYGFAGSCDTT